MPIMGFIGDFGYVAVAVVGAILTMKEMIGFEVIVAFIIYVRLFTPTPVATRSSDAVLTKCCRGK